ncbi:hypothetical protein FB567DRAFT_518271 [Paraphoma chrysanthemicola]|uniref:Nephrocystin 3-like N-terminal domain-containing protein n=1 Tax=Paraphoma chrysanthemicola TaxID=798071 RepID=A0A8K0RCT9_9PLEO|nr:hypothetical protein FB567DRAFT_518271 [Paraphoma chrysanthemicola]
MALPPSEPSSADRRRDPLVRDWMDLYGPDQHAVFRSTAYETQRAKAPVHFQNQASMFTDDFCNVLEQYQKSFPGAQSKTRIDLRGSHSWDEVIRAAKDAEAAYQTDRKKGMTGTVRGYFRHLGDYSVAVTPWVGLLPNDKYFSTLCGGLKLVLGMAAKRSERRVMILDAFETLPAAISKTQRCYELFPESLELRDRALTVYLDLLAMIEGMIACLLDKRLVDRIKDGLKGPMADLSLDEKVKRFNVSMEALDDQVNYLHFSASAKAHASIDIMAPALHNTEEVAMQTRELAVNIDDRTKLLNSHAAGVVTELHALRAGFASQSNVTRSVERQLDLNNRAIDHMSSVLHDVLENSEWIKTYYQKGIMTRHPEMTSMTSQLALRRLLKTDEDTAGKDLEHVTRQAQSSDEISQGAMHWVLQSSRFRHWVQTTESDVLLINGNLEDGMARITAMSLLCAMLVGSLRQQQGVYVLHYFCGTHNSRMDPTSGPSGMIRSLANQLLSMQQFDVHFIEYGQWKEAIEADSLSTMGRLFERLAEQVPAMMVFCIIDGISLFENETWCTELQLVINVLLQTTRNQELGAHVKLLFTCAAGSRALSSRLPRQNQLSVPAGAGHARLLTSRTANNELTRNGQLLFEEEMERSKVSPYYPTYMNIYDQGCE